MHANASVQKYEQIRIGAYRWRDGLAITQKLGLALGFAFFTGLMAQVKFPLPFTPVPITGQTFAVLLAGVMLGRYWGGITMALYAAIGAVGMPWFSGFAGGAGVLVGPTGGYIFGFILTALFLGHVTDKYVRVRHFWPMAVLMSLATLFLIFLPGLIQLGFWMSLVQGEAVSLGVLLTLGFWPFAAGAVVKIALAAGIAKAITPKK